MNLKYKFILPAALLLFVCVSCTKKAADANSGTVKLINDHFRFLTTHNLDSLRTQYTDNAHVASPDYKGGQPGPLGADEVFHYTFLLYPGIEYKVNKVTTTDSTAVVQFAIQGGKRGSLQTIFMSKGCGIYKIKNAKIDTEIMYINQRDTFTYVNGRFR